MISAANSNGSAFEKTGPQEYYHSQSVYGLYQDNQFDFRQNRDIWHRKVRRMEIEPTISMLLLKFRTMVAKPGFSIKAKDDVDPAIVDYWNDQLECKWKNLCRCSSMGMLRRGWQGFELVRDFDDRQQLFVIGKFKPLLHELTTINIYEDNGDFAGYEQSSVTLEPWECFNTAINVEGTNWYGRPVMWNLERTFDQKCRIETNAESFDGNVAAAHWVVYYPPGRTQLTNGELEDNKTIAIRVLSLLRSSGSAVIPNEVKTQINELNRNGSKNADGRNGKASWLIELLAPARTSGAAPYNDRLRYKDVEFARGLGFSERSVFEGEHGTKAEAETHADGSTGGPEEIADIIADAITEQVMPWLNQANFGPDMRDAVKCEANPMNDKEKSELKEIYNQLVSGNAVEEYDKTDMETLTSRIGIPRKTEEEIEQQEQDMNDELDMVEDELQQTEV